MKKIPILLHIGYHKTASSFLQSNLFNATNSSFVVPDEPRHRLVKRFVVPAPFTFNAIQTREIYSDFLQNAASSEQIAVFSHERFSGYPPTGGFDSALIARRLHDAFPEAGVLLVVREQLSHIRSMYSQFVTDGGDLSFDQYIERRDPRLKRVPGFSLDFYRYDLLVSHYRSIFGPEKVLVLPFELLFKRQQEFVSRVQSFTDAKVSFVPQRVVNSARSPIMQSFQRVVNRWFSENQLSPRAIFPFNNASKRFGRTRPLFDALIPDPLNRYFNNRLSEKIVRNFEGKFAESNVRLAELIGYDLSEFGYEYSKHCPAEETDFNH